MNLESLRATLAGLLEEWELTVDGAEMRGNAAVVRPVRTRDGVRAVLKVGHPHPEAEHEHLALKRWAGDGAVRLLRSDPARYALLLERLHATDLTEEWDLTACEVVAGLSSRLHVPALPQLRTLSGYVAEWTDELDALPASAPVPQRMVRQAVSIGRAFAADAATDGTLVHGDLHYENVLAADREPWLAIDPKPMSGDPHYELAPMLFNRFEELAGNVRWGVRARFHALVDAGGLDEDRARDWVVFRMTWNALDPDLDPSMCVAVVKAVQD